ncbi:MFS transporter [Mycobacterium sp. ACS4054]|uniref:MFS transporter n=1 Tax=Mycobacterium sp. ACS4054 TaxID=1834119 RepID=UPI0007FFF87B|nr:MFS transporter [Mycobacterium sp. ACS4054]OBF08359.1 MFS transporter [Mycobacterium sp. ACS4054]
MSENVVATSKDVGAPPLSQSRTVLMVAALALSVMSFMLNATMLGPAFRDINTHLGPHAYASMSAYFYLAGAIANVVLIRWSDFMGRKRVLAGILFLVCIGTLLCILGTSLPVVIVGRVLQGCANITYGLAFLIMREHLSGPAFGVCCGVISAINAGVAGVDAFLAGVMVDRFGYRSIFVLTLVVGVGAFALVGVAVPADERGRKIPGRMDWAGALLIAVAVAGLSLYVSNGGHAGWTSPLMLVCIATAIVAFVGLFVVEKRVATPLIHIDRMASRYAWPLIAVTILVFASFMVVLSYIIPSIAQNDRVGFGANGTLTALLFITPGALASLCTAPLVGRLAAKIGFVTVLRAGLVFAVAVTALLAVFTFDKGTVIVLMAVFGFALAVTLTPMSALGVLQAPEDEPGSLPGISNASYGIGGSLGFAWAGTVVGAGTQASYQTALYACVGIGIVAVAASLILKPRAAASPARADSPAQVPA